ncbi:hypothetical protein MHK_007310, partial [Candidatus Magnetomorum sp. HK-1]
LKNQESKDVPISKIKEIMTKLARGDLLEYQMFGNRFCKINDPILNDFLKVWGLIEVEHQDRNYVYQRTLKSYLKIKRKFNEYKGYLSEVYMIQVLWNSQRKKIPGNFFNSPIDIQMPNHFLFIDQRHRQHTGIHVEIDIFADATPEIWLAESKWHQKPVGTDVVRHMLKQKEIVQEREGDDLEKLTLWLFSYAGVTSDAENLMKQHGILWSSKDELNALLEFVGLRQLPEIM